MNDKIKLIKTNGTTVEGDIICFLEDTISSKRYIYYTLNEIVGVEPSSTIKIYVAKVKQNDETDIPISEEEWGKLKGFMGEVLKDTDNATIKYLPLSLLTDPTIVDEKVIAMPTMYDYISKHRGVYANKVATMEEEVAPVAMEQPSEVTPVSEVPVEDAKLESSPVSEPAPLVQEEVSAASEPEEPVASSPALEPIDLSQIEEKYNKLIQDINKLRNDEIEAAKRYNATLELSAMHNAQHASYVQSEQIAVESEPAPSVEPTPVVATPIEPQTNNVDIETNWFDIPQQN